MSSEKVIEKILADAQSQVQKIKARAAEKLSRAKAAFDAELKEYSEKTAELAEKQKEQAAGQQLAAARMQIAKENLLVKRQLIDSAFASAAEKIKNMSQDDYQSLMYRLIVFAVKNGDEEIIIDKNETKIDDSFVQKINNEKNLHLKLAEQRENIQAGFVLKKGKIRINASLDVLLSTAKQELGGNLAKELFS